MKHYVYELINPADNNVFYVGKGSGNRMYVHEYRAKRNHPEINENIKLRNKIKSILNRGDNIIYQQTFFSDSAEETYKRESRRIMELGLENLCNRFIFPPSSEEIYKIISMRLRGHKTSEETKEKIRQSLMGHSVSKKTREKIGNHFRGKPNPCSEKRKLAISLARKPLGGFPKVMSPSGECFTVGILSDFCKEHELHLPGMSDLFHKRAKSHRGWRLYIPDCKAI